MFGRKLHHRGRVDLWVSAGTIAIGAFFLYQASITESVADDVIGPRWVPALLSAGMIALGVLVAVNALLFNASRGSSDALHAQEPEEDFGFHDVELSRAAAVVAMGFVYLLLFHGLGYLLATFLTLFATFFVFGNRRVPIVLLLSAAGAIVYDYVFMGLMHLHNPPGAWIDVQQLLDAAG